SVEYMHRHRQAHITRSIFMGMLRNLPRCQHLESTEFRLNKTHSKRALPSHGWKWLYEYSAKSSTENLGIKIVTIVRLPFSREVLSAYCSLFLDRQILTALRSINRGGTWDLI